jgi:hypothetical protein
MTDPKTPDPPRQPRCSRCRRTLAELDRSIVGRLSGLGDGDLEEQPDGRILCGRCRLFDGFLPTWEIAPRFVPYRRDPPDPSAHRGGAPGGRKAARNAEIYRRSVVDHKTYREIADEYGLDWETIRKIVRKQKPK